MAERSYLCFVYDNKESVDEDLANHASFILKESNINSFLEICKENKKYVQLEIDFTEEK